ncbi:MAG TPA: hypothetical protein VMV24_01970 [Candidatus Dormibacteraeota bacterium]|nr:hypothetical protein [Candidatus Dormibacteraeota bacterium]
MDETQSNSQIDLQQLPDPVISPIEQSGLVDPVEPPRGNPFENDPGLRVISESIVEYGKTQLSKPNAYTTIEDRSGLKHPVESAEIVGIEKSDTNPEANVIIETILSRDEIDQNIQANNTVEILEEPNLEPGTNPKEKNIKVRLIILVTVGCLFTAAAAIKHHFDNKSS